jgi:hypothetical protein
MESGDGLRLPILIVARSLRHPSKETVPIRIKEIQISKDGAILAILDLQTILELLLWHIDV